MRGSGDGDTSSLGELLPCERQSPDDALDDDAMQELAQRLHDLLPDDAALVELSAQGHRQTDIAQLLGTSRSSVGPADKARTRLALLQARGLEMLAAR